MQVPTCHMAMSTNHFLPHFYNIALIVTLVTLHLEVPEYENTPSFLTIDTSSVMFKYSLMASLGSVVPSIANSAYDLVQILKEDDGFGNRNKVIADRISMVTKLSLLISATVTNSFMLGSVSSELYIVLLHIQSHTIFQSLIMYISQIFRSWFTPSNITFVSISSLILILHVGHFLFLMSDDSILSTTFGIITALAGSAFILIGILFNRLIMQGYVDSKSNRSSLTPEEMIGAAQVFVMTGWVVIFVVLHLLIDLDSFFDVNYCFLFSIMINVLVLAILSISDTKSKYVAKLAEVSNTDGRI